MKNLSTRSFTIIILVAVGLFGLTLFAVNQGWFQRDKNLADNNQPAKLDKEEPLPEGWVEVGGIRRPMTDVERKRNAKRQEDPKGYHPGGSPPVKKDANPGAKSVYTAFGNKKLASRISSMQPAAKFDLKAYQANPKAYLDVVEPARSRQSLPPSKDVAAIKRVGKYIHDGVLQGETVKLKVKVDKNMPVSFSSQRLGAFENGMTSITVAANDEGIAEVDFKLTPGTLGEIDINASSPVHSDVARWLIKVVRPRTQASK